jgi:hypothetical protein
MCLNPTNDSEVTIIEVWTEGSDLSTLEFGLKRNEIKGNSEYQYRRGFHKLSKEGGNSEFWYKTKEQQSVEVGRILKIWLQIGVDF